VVELAIVGDLSMGLMAAPFALKPLATAACLGAGSPGGLFTPTLTVGVLFTGVAGIAWSHVWHGAAPGSYALIRGGAFLAAAMQGAACRRWSFSSRIVRSWRIALLVLRRILGLPPSASIR
jgi:H+/Cl- antiporter ClcA